MSVIFVAMPTKGTTCDSSAARGSLLEVVYHHLAILHEQHPEYTFVAPMVQDYCLLPHLSVEPIWEVWGDRCRRLIRRCDEVWVLMYDGHDTSTGVNAEIEFATTLGIPVKYIDPYAEL